MTRRGLAFLILLLAALLPATLAGAEEAKGKQAFVAAKCNRCHAIESQSIKVLAPEEGDEADEAEEGATKPPDLSNAGADFKKSSEIEAWLTKKLERDGKKHRSMFRGTPADLKVLSEWLMTLKKAG